MPQGIPVSHCPGSNSHILVMSPEPRILTVADVFDALSAERPYRAAIPIDEVFKIMERDIGTAFDATCIDALKRGMQAMNARAA